MPNFRTMPRLVRLGESLTRFLDLVHFPERNMPKTVDGKIRKAMNEKRLVILTYDGYRRTVEIHVYGTKNEKDGLMTYQIRGKSSKGELGWKRLHIEKITSMRVLRERFPGKRMSSDRHSTWDKTHRIVDE